MEGETVSSTVGWLFGGLGTAGWMRVKWWALVPGSRGSKSATFCLVGHLVVSKILSSNCCLSLIRGSMAGGKRWESTAALWRRVQSPNALFDKNDKVSNLKKPRLLEILFKVTYGLYWVLWKAAAGWASNCLGWETGALFRRLSYSSNLWRARVKTLVKEQPINFS